MNRKLEQTNAAPADLLTDLSVGYMGPVPQMYTVVKYRWIYLRLKQAASRHVYSYQCTYCKAHVTFSCLQILTITILDIIHRPDFYFKHNASETGFCFRLQVKPIRLGPVDRASLSLRSVYIRFATYFSYLSSSAYQTASLYTYVFHWTQAGVFCFDAIFSVHFPIPTNNLLYDVTYRFCVNTQVPGLFMWHGILEGRPSQVNLLLRRFCASQNDGHGNF
jgi:hypothetical protein